MTVRHRAFRFCAFLVAAIAVAALFRLHNPTIPGTDSFRHFRQAALYVEHGPFISAFPWLPYSVVSRWASDLWYGFNLLLIPFAFIRDPILGIKVAAICETVVLLLTFWFVMRRHQVAYDYAWPFLLFFFAPATLYGLLMTRPHVLTMALAALLFSYLVTDSRRGALVSSLLLAWIHLNFFWVVPVAAAVVGVTKLVCERACIWRSGLAAMAGMTLGWLLRPHPIGSAKLLYVQLVELNAARHQGVPLMYADELKPVPLPQLASGFLYVLLIWLTVTAVFVIAAAAARRPFGSRRRSTDGGQVAQGELQPPRAGGRGGLGRQDRTLLWSSLALAVLFFAVTAGDTRRAVALWAVYCVVFAAVAFSRLLDPRLPAERSVLTLDTRIIISACIGIAFALMVGTAVSEHLLKPGMWRGDSPTLMQGPAEWLRRNTKRDEIVFNVNWGDFQVLFFWDTHNRYTSGLDPIFLYSYDHGLYWKAHHLQNGEGTAVTWATPDSTPANPEDTYTVLRRDFHASYILVRKQEDRYKPMYYYLQGDPRFRLAVEDEMFAVFRLAGAG